MISKSVWQNAYRDPLEKEQMRVGPPPTDEQIEALQRGDLPDDEAERVREVLSYYPDLVRAMTMPFPDGDEVLTQEELADLAALREKVQTLPKQPAVFPERRQPSRVLAIAASIVVMVAIAGFVVWLATPGETRSKATRVLIADGHRAAGAQTPIQLSTRADYLLKPVFRPERSYSEYRLDLLQADATPRVIWSRNHIRRQPDGSYPVELSTAHLAPGLYELVLYGVDGDSADRMAVYTIRISAS
ncbi:MAG TPA: hypothetical protein VN380_17075 [Thermoanaerobaculia bacterium]|jgi:hypothetical protein|nr:hypothetical protein [Thermoanaerobaculia bacterium]